MTSGTKSSPSLSILAHMTSGLSIFCLFLSFVTFVSLGNMRSGCNTIHANFVACLALAQLLFVVGMDVLSYSGVRNVWLSNITSSLPQPVKFPGLKSACIHTCKQYLWWSYNQSTFYQSTFYQTTFYQPTFYQSTFNTLHFDRNLFTCSCERGWG